MSTQKNKIFIYTLIAVVVILGQSSCSSAAQAPPTQTAVMKTSTPLVTSTPKNTATPKSTSTSTATPLPTPTFTPNVTATQIPEITPPAEGYGNVIGLVLWNNQPVAKAAVWLCHEFTYYGCNEYKTNADQNGYYVFTNITPGEYIVAINSFSSDWWIFYFDSNNSKLQKVSAGENLILDPWSIWKFDINAVYPKGDGKVISDAHPTFIWDVYPDAAYYQFYISQDSYRNMNFDKYKVILENIRVDGNEFLLEGVTLMNCSYSWAVEAYNAEGIKIAQMPKGYFHNVDLTEDC